MHAALLSNDPAAVALAAAAGAAPARLLSDAAAPGEAGAGDGGLLGGFSNAASSGKQAAAGKGGGGGGGGAGRLGLPSPEETARLVLGELGLQSADSGLDLVLLHADCAQSEEAAAPPLPEAAAVAAVVGGSKPSSSSAAAAVDVLEWADRTLRYLNNSAAFRDAVLLAVVATPAGSDLGAGLLEPGGTVLHPGSLLASSSGGGLGGDDDVGFPVARPVQSWQQLGGETIAVETRRPALCARRLPGVVRCGGARRLGLGEWAGGGGGGATLADRLLPEIAYKVGRAPKYGA
jgi:hypothetical protein